MSETPSSVDEHLLLLEGLETYRKHALQIIKQSRRHLYLLTRILDFPLYNHPDIETAISQLARSDRNAEVRILVKNIQPLVERDHCLLQLARRLPSKIKLRKLLIEPENDERAYLIGDKDLLLYQHDDREYSGFANYRAGPEIVNIMEEFSYLWQRQSADDVNLRNLTL
jgi:hypothetical protein